MREIPMRVWEEETVLTPAKEKAGGACLGRRVLGSDADMTELWPKPQGAPHQRWWIEESGVSQKQ